MDDYITRHEHEEFCRRQDEENDRQNKRLELLEENVRQIGVLTSSVKELATNMANMVKEQEKQGSRLEKLEGRDGDMWRTAVKYIISALIGGVIAFALAQIGM